jgi:hypothetical protein
MRHQRVRYVQSQIDKIRARDSSAWLMKLTSLVRKESVNCRMTDLLIDWHYLQRWTVIEMNKERRLYTSSLERICIDYTLEHAIKDGQLTPYSYYPVVVYLSDDELEKYSEISSEITGHIILGPNVSVKLDAYGEMLCHKAVAGSYRDHWRNF